MTQGAEPRRRRRRAEVEPGARPPSPPPEGSQSGGPAHPRGAGDLDPPTAPPRGGAYARSRARDERARAALTPLAPGERPLAVTIAAVVAALLAVANVVALLAGFESGEGAKTSGTLLGAALCAVMAVGMWRARYWAVLGFEALLGISVLLAALALMTAVNTAAVLVALAIIAGAGTLFWFLIKAMARLAMPERPGASPRG